MITFEGLFVPSITIVLPDGGADLSGVVMLIVVGSDLYGVRAAVAAAVPPEPDDAAVDEAPVVAAAAAALEVADEVEELDEPQAASTRARATVPVIAANPSGRGRPPLRRLKLVMYVSFRP